MRKATLAALLALGYIVGAVVANWLASKYVWTVPLTGGLRTPAGVFVIGALLVLRDWIQQIVGLFQSLLLVAGAALISYVAADFYGWGTEKIAVASLVAFAVSEGLEAVVFTPIRARSLPAGVAVSGVVGAAVDSWVFLTIAFASTTFFWGQFWAKTEMVAIGVALTLGRRRWAPVR